MHRMQTHALTEYHMNGRVFHPLWNPLAKPSISSTPSAIFFVSSYQSDPLSSAFGRDSRLYWPLTFHGEWELWSLYRLWKTHRETQRLSMNLQSLSVSLEQQQEVSFYGKMPLKSGLRILERKMAEQSHVLERTASNREGGGMGKIQEHSTART